MPSVPINGTLANRVDQDQTPQNAASDQCLLACLPWHLKVVSKEAIAVATLYNVPSNLHLILPTNMMEESIDDI